MSVFKRGERWYYAFMIRRRRYREVISEARTKAQALEAESRARDEVYSGKFGSRRSPELQSYCDRVFIPWVKNNHQSSENTLWRLNTVLRHFGKKKLDTITIMEVEKYKRKRLDAGLSPVTINKEIKLLKMILKMAHEAGVIMSNPLQRIRFLREPDHRQRVLSSDEEARLLRACPDGYSNALTSLRQAIVIALTTGMRQGEIYGLTWEQIDRERNVIIVEKSIRSRTTKTGRTRTIPLSAPLARLLDSIPRRKSPRVLNGTFFHELWSRALTRAEIKDLRFHDLRHTAATRLADVGVDVFTIQAILGHSSLAMTARYTHATSEGTRLAAEKLATTLPQTAFEPLAGKLVTDEENKVKLRRMLKAEVA